MEGWVDAHTHARQTGEMIRKEEAEVKAVQYIILNQKLFTILNGRCWLSEQFYLQSDLLTDLHR